MRCIQPLTLRDAEDRARTVPCGRCNFCLQSYRMDWTIRIIQEQKQSETANFLTLTYADEYLDYSPSGLPQLHYADKKENGESKNNSHLQLFFKRLRRENEKHTDASIRYFAIGEYGETYERPHYHAILFNMHSNTREKLDHIWPIGHYLLGTVQVASIHYVTGYLLNRYRDYGDRNPPFAVQSRKPGLGNSYILSTAKWHRPSDDENHWRNFTKIGGFTNRLPRYYREAIFSKEEREWLNYTAARAYDQEYAREIRRLSSLTRKDPHEAFVERMQHKHDQIKVSKNKNL